MRLPYKANNTTINPDFLALAQPMPFVGHLCSPQTFLLMRLVQQAQLYHKRNLVLGSHLAALRSVCHWQPAQGHPQPHIILSYTSFEFSVSYNKKITAWWHAT
ncbi:hypothetical protein ABKN59_002507 [Abortiporus biennis]